MLIKIIQKWVIKKKKPPFDGAFTTFNIVGHYQRQLRFIYTFDG